jgi:hypothetical protein
MKERLVILSVKEGEVGVTLGDLFAYKLILLNGTIVAITVSISIDDAGLDVDVDNVTGSSAIATAIEAATKASPGSWLTEGYGGTNTPVKVDAGDIISFDVNDAAANTTVQVDIWMLTGEQSA